jgi:hypothetical protein
MDTYVIALWVLLGFALSTWFMMHFWLPDPPPDILGKYIAIVPLENLEMSERMGVIFLP